MRLALLSLRRLKCIGRAGSGLIADRRGVTAIEYTMIAALIAMAIIVGVTQIGGFVKTSFETVAGSI